MSSINGVSPTQAGATSSLSKSSLGKDDFLNMMLLQMKNQDPLNPMDNQAMLSQMAQFSSLEQMSNLNETLQNFSSSSQFVNAAQLIGKTVAIANPSSDPAQSGQPVYSKVNSVSYSSTGPVVNLASGQQVTVENILGVAQ